MYPLLYLHNAHYISRAMALGLVPKGALGGGGRQASIDFESINLHEPFHMIAVMCPPCVVRIESLHMLETVFEFAQD